MKVKTANFLGRTILHSSPFIIVSVELLGKYQIYLSANNSPIADRQFKPSQILHSDFQNHGTFSWLPCQAFPWIEKHEWWFSPFLMVFPVSKWYGCIHPKSVIHSKFVFHGKNRHLDLDQSCYWCRYCKEVIFSLRSVTFP